VPALSIQWEQFNKLSKSSDWLKTFWTFKQLIYDGTFRKSMLYPAREYNESLGKFSFLKTALLGELVK